jgi:hypothetical protein
MLRQPSKLFSMHSPGGGASLAKQLRDTWRELCVGCSPGTAVATAGRVATAGNEDKLPVDGGGAALASAVDGLDV